MGGVRGGAGLVVGGGGVCERMGKDILVFVGARGRGVVVRVG